jgi:hypothetical protein
MTGEVHPFFKLFAEIYLELHPSMVRRLWGRLYPSETANLAAQAAFSACPNGPDSIVRLAQTLSPQVLLAACARLSPANGGRRARYVTEAEEAILKRVGPDGEWA